LEILLDDYFETPKRNASLKKQLMLGTLALSKATVVSHPIQGLVKYHGLKELAKRIPFHDSISVCIERLSTRTTVEVVENNIHDSIWINGSVLKGSGRRRVELVLNRLREKARIRCGFRVSSQNSIAEGKGLGFSSSGFSALGLAAVEALGLKLDSISLQEIVRLGSGSATRSLAGGFAIWYANRNGRSYAEMLAPPEDVHLAMVVVPIPDRIITDSIHKDITTSPFFHSRLKALPEVIESMKKAILNDDASRIGRLAEQDSLSLHAVTMTTGKGWILMKPETIQVINEVKKLRSEGLKAWFSLDTGPSVFINTVPEDAMEISVRIQRDFGLRTIVSRVGGPPQTSTDHLF
jgi:phosphomevalonate decarboxylase